MRILVSLCSLLLLFSSCKKDTSYRDVNVKNIAGIYKVTMMIYSVGNGSPVDGISTANACERDDLIQMNENFTFNYLDGGTQCNPPRIGIGSWGLPSSTVITISHEDYDIVSFDGKSLTLKQNTVTNSGESYKLNMIMVKQ